MAHGDTDNAAARLRELAAYYREHPVTGPAGHSYISSEPRSTAVTPALPLNIRTADHIRASLREVADHTHAVNPDAGPLPQRVQDAYQWMHDNTADGDEIDQQRAEVIEYRQWLEHCLRASDHETVRKQVRKQACPGCGCWGLMWMPERLLAVCTNTECVDRDGFSTTLSLSALAHAHVTERNKLRRARAT
jgi:hypothetical protein